MKCIAIGGVPASGKSTLMKEIINLCGLKKHWKYKLLNGSMFKNTCIIGHYTDNEQFGGTDRLSMAAPVDMMHFLDIAKNNILFEGDRLFTKDILHKCIENYDTRIIILRNTDEVLKQRHIDRDDNQKESFLKGRKTKINNILFDKIISSKAEFYQLNNFEETKKLALKIFNTL